MPDAFAQALATQGLPFILAAYLAAGVVRGFTGFGTALIVVPVAGIFLGPAEIILMIGVSGVLSNLILIPDAWRHVDRGEVGLLSAAALLGVPVGIWLLTRIDPAAIRWIVAVVAAGTLAAVMSGWQWTGRLGRGGLGAVGGAAGVVGGLTALTGPILIMFYLSNARRAVSVRANMIVFLAAMDLFLIVSVLLPNLAKPSAIWLGLLVSVPYLAAIMVGKALFDPDRERAYRVAAYAVVGLALVTGLPIWE